MILKKLNNENNSAGGTNRHPAGSGILRRGNPREGSARCLQPPARASDVEGEVCFVIDVSILLPTKDSVVVPVEHFM